MPGKLIKLEMIAQILRRSQQSQGPQFWTTIPLDYRQLRWIYFLAYGVDCRKLRWIYFLAYGVDYRKVRWIYFLDPPRGLGVRHIWQ